MCRITKLINIKFANPLHFILTNFSPFYKIAIGLHFIKTGGTMKLNNKFIGMLALCTIVVVSSVFAASIFKNNGKKEAESKSAVQYETQAKEKTAEKAYVKQEESETKAETKAETKPETEIKNEEPAKESDRQETGEKSHKKEKAPKSVKVQARADKDTAEGKNTNNTKEKEQETAVKEEQSRTQAESIKEESGSKKSPTNKRVGSKTSGGGKSSGGDHTAPTKEKESTDKEKDKGQKESETKENKGSKESKESKENKKNKEYSKEYIILNENTGNDGALHYTAGKSTELSNEALIGMKNTGENSGETTAIEWAELKSGDMEKVKAGIKGEYELLVKTKSEFRINDMSYNNIEFIEYIKIN